MAFIPRKEVPSKDLKTAIIANSEAIAIGDAIIPDGTVKSTVKGAKNTTGIILGVVFSILGTDGKVLEKNTVTVGADNATVAKISVKYIPAYLPIEYTADISQAAGTTTASDLMGQFNLSASVNGTLDETSVGVFSTQKQFFSFGVTPESTTKVIGKFSTTLVC